METRAVEQQVAADEAGASDGASLLNLVLDRPRSMATVRAIAVVAVAIVAVPSCQGSSRRSEPEEVAVVLPKSSGAEPHLLRIAGPDARNCGRFGGSPYGSRRRVKPEARQGIAQCITEAWRVRSPLFFAVEGSAVDSWVVTGLIGTRDGRVQVFWYDSRPCGGPGCVESFETYTCDQPASTGDLDPEMRCNDKPHQS
jgi:hypothetical protein